MDVVLLVLIAHPNLQELAITRMDRIRRFVLEYAVIDFYPHAAGFYYGPVLGPHFVENRAREAKILSENRQVSFVLETHVLKRKMAALQPEWRQHDHIRVGADKDPNRRRSGARHLEDHGLTEILPRPQFNRIAGLRDRHRRLQLREGFNDSNFRRGCGCKRCPAYNHQPKFSKKGHSIHLCIRVK